MSSPTELLPIAGKTVPPAQPTQIPDTKGKQKNDDFSDAYQEEVTKLSEATVAEAESEIVESFPVPTDESILEDTAVLSTETREPDVPVEVLEKKKTDAFSIFPEPKPEGKIQVVSAEKVEAFSNGEVVTESTAVAVSKPSEVPQTSEPLQAEVPIKELDVDPNQIDADFQKNDDEVETLAPKSGAQPSPELPIRPEPSKLAEPDVVPPNDAKPERLESQKVTLQEATLAKVSASTHTPNVQNLPPEAQRELVPKQEARSAKIETETREVKIADALVKPTAPPAVVAQAQPAVPAWMTMIQSDQSRDIQTTALPNALEELSSYQQQARFEPVSSFQRYDAPTYNARQVVQQVAYAVSQNAPGTTEIKLSPEELGRVRMTVQAVEGMINVVVVSERQETGDLMRRNSEMLTEELRDLGFDSINLTFGNEQSGPQSNDDAEQPEFAVADHMPGSEDGKTVIVSRTLSEGLDLRM